jgi:hypothetical protein
MIFAYWFWHRISCSIKHHTTLWIAFTADLLTLPLPDMTASTWLFIVRYYQSGPFLQSSIIPMTSWTSHLCDCHSCHQASLVCREELLLDSVMPILLSSVNSWWSWWRVCPQGSPCNTILWWIFWPYITYAFQHIHFLEPINPFFHYLPLQFRHLTSLVVDNHCPQASKSHFSNGFSSSSGVFAILWAVTMP